MRVLLIQSYLGRKENLIFPIGLAYLANSLKEHEVSAFDPNIEDDPYGAMRKIIKDFNPDVIGISLRNIDTTSYKDMYYHYKTLEPTIKLIKEASPHSCFVIGGAAFSLFAEELMNRHSQIDFGVYLEGEKVFPELLNNLSHPQRVKGIYYRQNGLVLFSGMHALPDLEDISPNLDLFDISRYKLNGEEIGVQSKRGCMLHCSYCTYPFLTGNSLRLRPPKKVLDEIEQLISKYGLTKFTFADTVFNIPRQHAVDICEEIIKRGIKVGWSAFFSLKGIDEDFLKLAHKAGCYSFIFSPDGYSDKTLKALRKEINKKDIKKVYDLAKRFKISKFDFSFFINAPGQSYRDLLALLWLLIKTNFILPRRKFIHITVNIPRIEPHTDLYKLAIREGTLSPSNSLLPLDAALLPSIYYRNPHNKLAELVFKFLLHVKNALIHLRRNKQ